VANETETYHLELRNLGQYYDVFFSAPVFAYLAENCQSLKALTLENIALDEDHCRVLGNFSKPGLEVELNDCRIVGVGDHEALAEVLGRNQGPTKLNYCHIDSFFLANGLRGNSRLKSFTQRISRNQELLPITGALHDLRMSDETWDTVFDSLKTRPTIQVLSLQPVQARLEPPLKPAQLKSRIQRLMDMLKMNVSIHNIRVHDYYSKHEHF
jgi:hypothetical protein